MYANHNAPPAVTYSAIIYALRCMVTSDIPLNQVREGWVGSGAQDATRERRWGQDRHEHLSRTFATLTAAVRRALAHLPCMHHPGPSVPSSYPPLPGIPAVVPSYNGTAFV